MTETSEATRDVAFVGLGTMGQPMAECLVRAGYEVSVVPPRRRVEGAPGTLEARVAATPAEAVEGARFLVTMLPTAADVESVLFGQNGAVSAMPAGGMVIDMSTIGPHAARDLGRRLAEHQLAFLDAPVSGGPARAAAGTLTVIVGGREADLDDARPVLEAMSSAIFHAGDCGAGQTAKACNNLLVAACMLASVEALALGAAAGVAPECLRDIVLASSGSNWQLENIVPQTVLKNDFSPIFALPLLEKDLGIAAALADETGAPFFVGGLAREMYRRAGTRATEVRDFSSVAELYSELLGGGSLDEIANRTRHEPSGPVSESGSTSVAAGEDK
jgi:3-hydroxyisobutyrate dehydrogenase